MDGLRAQTWQAGRSQRDASRRTGSLLGDRRSDRGPLGRALRHHAGYGYAITSRRSASDGGHARASAQPSGLRFGKRSHRRRLFDSAASVGISLPSAARSRFAQLFSDDAGIDPYTRVVSDVYQDLFGEGSFIGKGIYDVDSFERQCSDFPDNAILSHDLLEGAYCRSALLSDVTLYEEHPARYTSDVDRRHRWMRGDWQIVPWLLPKTRGRSDRSIRNPISLLSRWKIFDNLRRSLVPIAMLILLVSAWLFSSAMVEAVTMLLASAVLLPALLAAGTDLVRKPVTLPWSMHWRTTLQSLKRPLAQCLLTFVFLPYEAYISADAIVRTLIRMGWTKRRLLEWKTASDSERSPTGSLEDTYRAMVTAPALAVVSILVITFVQPKVLLFAGPWIVVWLASPLIAWWLSKPIARPTPQVLQGAASLSREARAQNVALLRRVR